MTNFKNGLIGGLGILLSLSVASCKNGNNEFPDFDGGITAYFANQYPVTVVVLGEYPDGDNSDNIEHKINIYATQGGAYDPKDLKIDVVVDNSLVSNLYFPDGSPVKAMPESYYTLESNTLTLSKKHKDEKKPLFGTKVLLTDAFFNDPASVKETYVIPVKMVKAIGADRILSGTPAFPDSNPALTDASAWDVQPQDFTLYCVKYVNPWAASYLRRGVDQVTDAVAGSSTNVRHEQHIEKNEVVYLTTESMNEVMFPLSTIVPDGESVKTLTCNMILKFNGDDCTISTNTEGMTASGSGKFVKRGDKNFWGDSKEHDVLYLDYQVNFGPRQFNTKDTLVVRSREIAPVFDFKPVYKN
ncbi:MAG: DUF1735 domain-containing protein [Muribaculaceae bacterium]|nr:DUF1735 domain-containing protein [Muribaculaceae bacterium]